MAIPRLSRSLLAVLLAVGLAGAASSALAQGAGPAWMPGFPMRMGPNVMLMWAPVPGAASYNVYRSEAKGELGAKLANVPMNNHMDVNAPSDKDLHYAVRPVMADGGEGPAGPVSVLAGVKPLDPPKWTGELYQAGQLTLRWDRVQGAAFYNVYQAESSQGPFALAGSVQDVRYVLAGVEEGKTYHFQVSAVDKNNMESARSQLKSFTVPKAAAVARAKTWELVEKVIPFVGHWYGAEDKGLRAPSWLASDATADLVFVAEGQALSILDGEGETILKLQFTPTGQEYGAPQGVAMGADGTVWTTWYPYGGVRQFAADGTLVTEWRVPRPTREDYAAFGRAAEYAAEVTRDPAPTGVCLDAQGRVWVSEPTYAQVLVFRPDGTLLKRIGEPRTKTFEPKHMKSPSQLAYHRATDRVYLVEPTIQMVRAFSAKDLDFIRDEQGELFYGWRRNGNGPGYMQTPKGIAVTPEGDLAILDGIDNRIQVFDPDLEYRYTVTTRAGARAAPQLSAAAVTMAFHRGRLLVSENLGQRLAVLEWRP